MMLAITKRRAAILYFGLGISIVLLYYQSTKVHVNILSKKSNNGAPILSSKKLSSKVSTKGKQSHISSAKESPNSISQSKLVTTLQTITTKQATRHLLNLRQQPLRPSKSVKTKLLNNDTLELLKKKARQIFNVSYVLSSKNPIVANRTFIRQPKAKGNSTKHLLTDRPTYRPTLPPITNFTDTVTILTPISNVERKLERYLGIIKNFTYPKHLISIALGEDSSKDGTFKKAKNLLQTLDGYHNTDIFKFPSRKVESWSWEYVHRYDNQKSRRAHMAKSRNSLMFSGLGQSVWALWIDSDITSAPSDLIEQLLSAKKDIVVPGCYYRNSKGYVRVYDKNTWKETKSSKDFLRDKAEDFLMLEGYDGFSRRKYLLELRSGKPLVRIDGVGGCVLLIRGILHKQGLIFPPFIFKHHIETEGLAKVATKMGVKIYGMPYVQVFH